MTVRIEIPEIFFAESECGHLLVSCGKGVVVYIPCLIKRECGYEYEKVVNAEQP